MKKHTCKKLDCAKKMPSLSHSSKIDTPFNIRESEAAQWLCRQPSIMQYIFDKANANGLIEFDQATGFWQGIDAAIEETDSVADQKPTTIEVLFFKPSGKYYTEEHIALPEYLDGSIDAADKNDCDCASKLMYDRRVWLRNAVSNLYKGMHVVCTDSDVIGFPFMLVRSEADRDALYEIASKIEARAEYGSFEAETANRIREALCAPMIPGGAR